MTRNPPGYVPIDVVEGLHKPYRLWRKPPITAGNPVIILAHGAVVPLLVPNELHNPNTLNNDKYCFYYLDSLLYEDFHHNVNVFTFEYADWSLSDPIGNFLGNVNYHRLAAYGGSLIEAIRIAKEKSKKPDGTVGPVYVIAHSMGGLVARYAVQALGVSEVDKIITLDTGHHGFDLAAIVDNIFVDPLTKLIPPPTLCCIDAAPNSKFVNDLNSGFATCPALVSIAALDPVEIPSPVPGLPPIKIIVVDTHSSNMGQFHPLHYNHLSIAQIIDSDHGAYRTIKKCLS